MSASWDWVGVVGTGQSLSVGTKPIPSTTRRYGNLMLSLGGVVVPAATAPWWDPSNPAFEMVPLVEPLRSLQTAYPAPYPGNLFGETPHAAMANQLSLLVKKATPGADYVTVHTVVGESGQGIVALNKQTGGTTGPTGRAYAATLFEVAAIARLAAHAGKTYGVGVVVMTHGETDAGNSTYEEDLVQLMADYNADIAALTGQTRKIPMFLSQQFGYPQGADQRPVANLVQWRLGVEHPGDFVCTGPKYQYPARDDGVVDGVHLSVTAYQQIGEKTGQILFERMVLGHDWQPLQPIGVRRDSNVITVQFHVPAPPLRWDQAMPPPTAFPNGRGFEVRQGDVKIPITSVAIADDTVQITCAGTLPASGLTVGYAMSASATQMDGYSRAFRWGQLVDSDPFVGSTTNLPNPNYCVSFELPVP
jgi:hypothetical protein